MFVARDTTDGRLWFRLRDCAAYFGSLFCVGWECLGNLVRDDVAFLPHPDVPDEPFDQALVRDLGLLVLAEWNDPDVWLWMQGEDASTVPPILDQVYGLVKEPFLGYEGVLAGKGFAPVPEGWKCSRCGRFPSHMSLTGRVGGVPLYSCGGQEEAACLSS